MIFTVDEMVMSFETEGITGVVTAEEVVKGVVTVEEMVPVTETVIIVSSEVKTHSVQPIWSTTVDHLM